MDFSTGPRQPQPAYRRIPLNWFHTLGLLV